MTNTTKCTLFMIRRNIRNGMIPLVLLMPFMAIAAFEIAKKYFGKILLPYSHLFAAILPLIVPTVLLFLSSMMMLS